MTRMRASSGKNWYVLAREDGTDFFTGTYDYAAAVGGSPITIASRSNTEHITTDSLSGAKNLNYELITASNFPEGSSDYLTRPDRLIYRISMHKRITYWPNRVFRIEGKTCGETRSGDLTTKHFHVLEEVEAHATMGKHGKVIERVMEQTLAMTEAERFRLEEAYRAVRFPHGFPLLSTLFQRMKSAEEDYAYFESEETRAAKERVADTDTSIPRRLRRERFAMPIIGSLFESMDVRYWEEPKDEFSVFLPAWVSVMGDPFQDQAAEALVAEVW